ncbi:hypothetical protein [Desulfopila inferna]|uniref:hypothetical protein n=1 Tax=Desulfopila inferna TaxID=468528 RepID=UPI001964FC34|nr:hypothetical protein [Desulfopila inferna]MBM9602695.1 hypothetical protein [Desulfopila inferna]
MMLKYKTNILGVIVLVFCLVLIGKEVKFHFQKERITEKLQHFSAVRHWSIHFGPQYVYYNSSLRYESDFKHIRKHVEPKSALLSDLATSYYAAAALPVYIRNTHRHHGLKRFAGLQGFLQKGHLCYLNDPYHSMKLLAYLEQDALLARKNGWPALKYIIINKDKKNKVLYRDCIATNSRNIIENISSIASIIYEGKYLNLYALKDF